MTTILVSESISEVIDYLNNAKSYVVCDIETTSLHVGKGEILCIAFLAQGCDDVMVWYPKKSCEIQKLRIKKAVFHNAYFDERWLTHHGAKINTVWDTMIMAHLLDENTSVSLKSLGQRLLGYEDWSESEIDNLVTLPREQISKYVAKDVVVTYELLRWQMRKIKRGLKPGEDPVSVMRNIILPAMDPLIQMEDNMLPVRLNKARRELAQVSKRISEIEKQLDSSIPPKETWPDWLRKTNPKWGNTNWTKWWLYVHQGAPVVSRGKPTKTWADGNPSLSQENLMRIDHPAAQLLVELSSLRKTVNTFLVPLLERSVGGRIPTSFKLTGTVTGRLSSASPGKDNPGINSQQIPRDPKTRNLFGEKGLAWIEADYSQLELRVAAVLANETTMIKLFETGQDIHTYMARQLVGSDDVTKEQRSLAKGVNFGFLYGMRSKHFANYLQDSYGLIISEKEAESFRDKYFETFSALPEWYIKQRKFCLQHGGVPNVFGRFRHLPKVYEEDYWIQENAFRQAINSPVQSTGSDFMLVSLARMSRDSILDRLGVKLITTVHDSVEMTVPYRNAKKAARRIKEIMESADDSLDRSFMLKADVAISRCWGGDPLFEL